MKPSFRFRLYNQPTAAQGNAPTYTAALRAVAQLEGCDVRHVLSVFDPACRSFFVWTDDAEPAAEICITQTRADAVCV